MRVSERLECERVELANVRKQKERDRRAEQNEAHVAEEAKAKSKSTASVFAHTYVGDVVTDVFDNLEGAGFFFDPLLREIEETFLPWLAEGVHATILAAQDNEKAMSQVGAAWMRAALLPVDGACRPSGDAARLSGPAPYHTHLPLSLGPGPRGRTLCPPK